MYRIAILDDERKEAEHIRNLADMYFDRKELMQRRIDIYDNGSDLLAHVRQVPCDLLFLDIEVGQENGIEIGRQLRKIVPDMIIIVITGYLKYSVEGYKIQAARYLLKPVNAHYYTVSWMRYSLWMTDRHLFWRIAIRIIESGERIFYMWKHWAEAPAFIHWREQQIAEKV